MAARHDLTLYQEILLLALHDEKGTATFGSMHGLALGGAILAELMLAGRLDIAAEGRYGLVTERNPKTTGDPILDDALKRVRTAKRRAPPSTWVSRFGGTKDLQHGVARSLAQRGVLREAEGRVLLVFSRRTWPTLDPSPERALIERIRSAIVGNAEPDGRTAIVIALAKSTGLLAAAFDRKELKANKARIEAIANGSALGRATHQAVEAVQAAVMAATTAATIAATSAAAT